MIIHSISAINVLKYEKLELKDLPEEGVIAISGFNESGKSTIGETICFALFGRTFSINQAHLDKLIRWGESDCSVTIRFSCNKSESHSGELYAITRMLDCDGNHSAKLYKVYNEENPIARGVGRVEEALFELTSVEYEEFIESFYLAQREITTPHPHSYALKTMAGIATMEHCDTGIREDIAQDISLVADLTNRVSQLDEQVSELELDETYLDTLTAQHDAAQQEKAQTGEILENYQTGMDDYDNAVPMFSHYKRKKGRGVFWRIISFALALLAFALWWVLLEVPDAGLQEQVSSILQKNIPQLSSEHYPYLLYLGGFFTFLFLAFWAAIISHKRSIRRLQQFGTKMADKMQALDLIRETEPDEVRELMLSDISSSTLSSNELADGCANDLAYLRQQQEQQVAQISELSSALSFEGERVNRAKELQEKISALQFQIEDKEARNKTRELATELLLGANRHLSKRFNHIIREHVGKTLPLFTDNRYEHLQIDDDLTVRVFSNEKHDFMDLDEISSGTQRQIMLAVRLALSQEMVSRKVQSHQFLILDEPFAFFDEERTERSLAVLPQLSDDLPQIWVIAQTFPEEMNFERTIYCERDVVNNAN